jgi:4-hydroxy-4-methyl-2-oxoglutarate aldolase
MANPLTPEQLRALAHLDTCTVANAIEPFQVRLRNEGFCDGSIRCLLPLLPPVVGYAVTGKIRSAVPPTVGRNYHERTDWWDHILRTPAPRIVVLQDVDAKPGLGSLVEELHANILRALGCIACVTNGAVRDLPAAERIGFQLFAGSLTVSNAFAHLLSFGEPVEIGTLKINSGDLLHGDRHGVLSIPFEIAVEIPAMAEKVLARRQRVIDLCQSPGFSLAGLRESIKDVE